MVICIIFFCDQTHRFAVKSWKILPWTLSYFKTKVLARFKISPSYQSAKIILFRCVMVIPSGCTHRSLAMDTTWQSMWIWLGLPAMGVRNGCVVWVFFCGTNAPVPPELLSLPQAKWRCCSLVWTRHSYTWMMSLGNKDKRCFSTAWQTYTRNRLSYFGNSSCWGVHPGASNLAAVM